jgi:hypothetical protein
MTTDPSGAGESYVVADAFLEALAEVSRKHTFTRCFFLWFLTLKQQAGVDYLFTVLGSDHPSIIEAYVRRQKVLGREFPRMILFQHEVSSSIYIIRSFQSSNGFSENNVLFIDGF